MPSSMFVQLATLALIAPAIVLAQQVIHPHADHAKCLQPSHASMVDGTGIVLGPCNGSPEQDFFLENGLVRVFSNMCVAAGVHNGDQLTIATCDDKNDAQMWTYDVASSTFQNPKSGSCMDLTHGALAVGSSVGLWTCSPHAVNQVFHVGDGDHNPTSHDPGHHPEPTTSTEAPETTSTDDPETTSTDDPATTSTDDPATTTTDAPAETTDGPAPPTSTGSLIKAVKNGHFCIKASENRDGAPVVLALCDAEDEGQGWIRDGTELTVFGDKCLDVTEGENKNRTKLQIWTCVSGGSNQKWKTSKNNQHIAWINFDKCVDATDGVFKAGQPVQIWHCSGSKNQDWVFQ